MKKILCIICMVCCMSSAIGQIKMDKTVIDGRVDSVWQGINLPQAFSGEGVIIGVADWGFDYTHPVFYDTSMTHYRVLRAWDQFKTSGPAPSDFSYGTEYTSQEQLLTAHCDTSNCYGNHYHGTYCASIAAGAGAGTAYRGVSYNADLLFVSLYLDSIQRIMDAWNWMYNVAQQEGKRLVISGSWGLFYIDNMDGTGMLANEIQRLTDLGVIFVFGAGNNGAVNFHIQHEFTESNDTIHTQFLFPSNANDLWGSSISMLNSANSPFSFSLSIMDSNYQKIAETPFIPTANNDGYVDTFLVYGVDTIIYNYDIQSVNIYNQSPVVRLRVKELSDYNFVLSVTAESGKFHAWNIAEVTQGYGNWGADFVAPAGHSDWIAGNNEYGLHALANVDCAITVASHKKQTTTSTGQTIGGDIIDVSSSGPGFHEGVRKPEISAPADDVISAISSYTTVYSDPYETTVSFNDRTYGFGIYSGTGMSAPFVSGVIALILQANPYLTPAQVKDVLTSTAYNDSYTAAAGINRFGYGKINAYQAVVEALHLVGVEDNAGKLETRYSIFPNPTSDVCYVTAQTTSEQVQCFLYDLTGRMVRAENFRPGVNTLSLKNLPSGCYILRISDNNQLFTRKIILQ